MHGENLRVYGSILRTEGTPMRADRTRVERALYARAERLADIDRRNHPHWDHHHCYACGSEQLAPLADGDLALCVNCQELVDAASSRRGQRGC